MSPDLNRQRRVRLAQALRDAGGGVAILPTAPERRRNSDNDHPHRFDSHFHYPTGFAEPESWPIGAVVAGLLVGNHGRTLGMSDITRDHLDKFWTLVEEVLNAVLFVLIGLEMMRLKLSAPVVLAGVLACAVVLASRLLSIALPAAFLRSRMTSQPGAIWILTWGGLRGGISVALALTMPSGTARDVFVVITYVVVIFSVLVQGLTLGRLARSFRGPDADEVEEPSASH